MKNFILVVILIILFLFSCKETKEEYVCTPCDLACDTLIFSSPGTCPYCKMELIKKSDLEKEEKLKLNEVNIHEGPGSFIIEGGVGNRDKTITVFYYKPKNYQANSNVLMVIPGAGRNGDSYRDAWIEEAEQYNVLILSPMYPKEAYGFADYHMCGLMSDLNLRSSIVYLENSNVAQLDEDKFSFKINSNNEEWMFNDFDRIFNLSMQSLNATQTHYDMFGHSAGGQILHRLAIFCNQSKAKRIISANSGFYTLTDFNIELPFGLKNTSIKEDDLKNAFKKRLVIFNGELDNENETGGTLLRSTTVDKQGLHRLERGAFFYNNAKTKAEKMNTEFNWDLKVIPNIGHNHREMGDAVGRYLYDIQ